MPVRRPAFRGSRRGTPTAAALAAVLLVGCGGSGDGAGDGGSASPEAGASSGSAESGVEIAVIPKGTTHDFWKMIEAGARRAALELDEEAGVPVDVRWKGPLKEDDTKDQIDIVRSFIARRVDGMCLAPLDGAALAPAVRDVMQAGIPVVVFDSGLDGEPGTDYVAYVATDNEQGGVLAARRLAEVLQGKGRVLLLRYMVGSESTRLREKGFTETLAAEFPEIELVSGDQYAGATENQAFKKAQNLLTRYRGGIDGIFCPNESSAAGMLGALRQAGLAGDIRFVGFDASDKLLRGIREGEVDGLVVQEPVQMAYEAVRLVVKHLGGEDIPAVHRTGVHVITPENVDDPALRAIHSPDLSRWLGEEE